MPITTDLLARLRSLDDLHELVAELGYTPGGDELSSAARSRLGLGADGLGVRRAAIVGHRGPFVVYGAIVEDAARHRIAQATERLARATAGERNLLFAIEAGAAPALSVAAVVPAMTGFRARQLRIPLDRPSAVAAEILGGLTPRPGDSALALSMRVADTLGEEGLTSRFFREFTRLHEHAAQSLAGVPRATPSERRDLALVILTRVLFLYFVQAKGWLAGRSDFLPSVLDTALRSGRPFHRSAWEPLCFGALSTPRHARRGAARALADVPFLNGGLFERHALERRFPDAVFPNDTWRLLFDELFERFHFTVREHDDDAVDPEMLGRVFEGLMAEDRRRNSGTYFTPRDLLRNIVSRVLDAALDPSTPETVQRIRILDPAVGSGAFLLEALAQLEQRRAQLLPDERPLERRRAIVRDCLYGVDQDPMAVRLAELRLWLALVADDESPGEMLQPLPNLDQNLRQGDSLLSPLDLAGAARFPGGQHLRAVAERRARYFAATGREKASLAQGLRCAEREIALGSTEAAIGVLSARLADVASQGRDLFGARPSRGPGLRARVADWRRRRRELIGVRRRIATEDALPFFAYDVHFGHILADGGFDAIIGNPPWVRGERLPLTTRTHLAARYRSFRAAASGHRGFAHLPDLSVAFVERSLQLVRHRGIVGFLLPAKLLRAGYAAPLRAMIREQATMLCIDDRSHAASSGFAATVFPMVCVMRREPPDDTAATSVAVTSASGTCVSGIAEQRDLALDPALSHSPWLAYPGTLVHAIRSALSAGPALGSRFHPRLGIKTGANDIFLRDLERAGELPREHRVAALRGRDIGPFVISPSAMILAAVDSRGVPLREVGDGIREYLRPYASVLARRADANGDPPWTLFRTELLAAPWMVLWRDIASRLEAAAIERTRSSPIPLNSCYGVAVPDRFTACWLSAWLTARPIRTLSLALAERASGGAFRFSAAVVARMPLPGDASHATVAELAELGRHGHEGREVDDDALAALAFRILGRDSAVNDALVRLDSALRRDAGGTR